MQEFNKEDFIKKNNLWDKVLHTIRSDDAVIVDQWLYPLKRSEQEDSLLAVCQDPLLLQIAKRHYELVKSHAKRISGREIEVYFELDPEYSNKKEPSTDVYDNPFYDDALLIPSPTLSKETPNPSKKTIKNSNLVSGIEIEKIDSPNQSNFVLPGLLSEHIGILCSPGGMGKSGLALILANQIASGGKNDFLGLGTLNSGAVCYLSLEDPLDTISSRQREVALDFTTEERSKINKNLHFIDGTTHQQNVTKEFLLPCLKEAIENSEEKKLRLLIIDHLSYWTHSDLNDGNTCTQIMKELKKLAKELGCAILVLHHANRGAMQKGKDKPSPSSTIGGSYKLHSLARWVAFIESVSKTELKKEFKIEGGDDTHKIFTLDKVNHGKKLRILLQHNDKRCGLLYATCLDAKELQSLELQKDISENRSGFSMEEKLKKEGESFNIIKTIKKLAALDENKHHVMNWMTRMPIFEVVDDIKRGKLTFIDPLGLLIDKNRENVTIFQDIWSKGDVLRVDGPVCDYEDEKLFISLMKLYTESHKCGSVGLHLDISLSSILNFIELCDSGKNFEVLNRRLKRLNKMHLTYKNNKNNVWSGPLIMALGFYGDGPERKVRIHFNPYMIAFYKTKEYTIVNKALLWSLCGDSAALLLFYSSHKKNGPDLELDKICKAINIPYGLDNKARRRRISNAHKKLKDLNILDYNIYRDGSKAKIAINFKLNC